ncbi:response regulator transcription factor [Granulicella cerasi]|uniref:Response regulator transcription factor n=1 Tax=Granulicella cerasi TaxID=741063 RepID=A0ABW1Z5R4_9BACT|nr:response regulator transcription factor [Granulicella cerasi]
MLNASQRSHILVVEDDSKLASALVAGIESDGHQVTWASSAEEGFYQLHQQKTDLLVLDVTLPRRDGFDLLRQIREDRIDVRVLMLTSHNSVEDRVHGLRTGADDYLGKPFSFPELLARIDALLRRILPQATSESVTVGDLSLNTKTRAASRAGKTIELSAREFDLLLYLAENGGRTVSREMLARDVWKESSRYTPLDNVIDVQINRLRKKVDDSFSVKLIHTVRGLGFSLREPEG